MTDVLMLVNAEHPLPLDWEPDDLVDLWGHHPRHFRLPPRPWFLAQPAFEAANALFAAAEEAGYNDFVVRSSYRSARRQRELLETEPDPEAVAPPGASEHQTGLAIDVGVWNLAFDAPACAEERAWLLEHCWEYGFIQRYPEGKEDVTGVKAEPWHLRFVGREVAREIRERGWVLEEWHAAKA